jgi:hypothetical protein
VPRALATAALAALILAVPACKETQELRNLIGERLQESLVADDKPDTSSAPLPPELISAKLSLYIDCVGSTRVPLYDGFRQVNAAARAGKKARRQSIDLVLEEAFEKCVKAQREAPLLQPPLPELENAATTYLASARELAAAIVAVREALVDDSEPRLDPNRPDKKSSKRAGKKSSKQQPTPAPEPPPVPAPAGPVLTDPNVRFAAAFGRWDEARRDLDDHIDGLQATVDTAVLATVERKSGKRIEWYTRDLVRATKPYVRCLGDHDEITAKICEAFFKPMAAAREAFFKIRDTYPRGADEVFWMPQFIESLDDFYKEADALRAALAANTARSSDLGRTIRAFNDLVHDFGQLNFSAAEP